ncbi:facilitated trehalose transporter Tret1-like [Pieris napi]|uniref:facilitated trehalose transporter Tret1-like n=1 Tax=Pieris napi TaxID=78633 RepID=UPI001FBBC274|nr:facilitated trehalose transporter Tret1-like [Pieris napi]
MNISPAFLKQLWLTVGASLAFLIIGLVRGYTASALPSIEQYNPTIVQHSEQKSWTGAIASFGAFLGSMCSGPLMQRAGRKRALKLTAPLWIAAWIIVGFARIFPILLLGRILTGLCVGFVLAPVQVYVSECCDPEIRGRLGSLPTLSMSLGILISYIAGSWLYWRYLAFLSATFCVGMFVALLPLPESPVWLETQGLDNSASMKWLHLSKHAVAKVKDGIQEPVKSISGNLNPVPAEPEPKSLFTREVFFSSPVIKPLIIVFALLFFQQFSGIDAVIFFTVEIFQKSGSKLDPMMATITVGAVQLFSNGISTILVDRAGRRPLLLLSAATMSVSMVSMGASFYFEFDQNSWMGYLPIASLVVFMLGFSLGFGGLPFLLLGELFPKHYRSQLSGMASAVNLLSMFSVIKSYHALDLVLTSAGTFWLYAVFCGLALVFVAFFVPETKGKSLAEIEQHFRGNKHQETVSLQNIQTKF